MHGLVKSSSIFLSFCIASSMLAAQSQGTGNQPGGAASAPPPAAQATSVTPPAPVTAGELTSVAPGPLEEQRKALLEKINASKKLGIGVGPYIGAFAAVEGMIKAGAPEDQILKRVNSIRSSLLEQAERIKDIKTRPPLAPTAVTSSQSSSGSAASGGGGGMIEQLKAKFGDQIPGALNNPELREKLSNPETREKLMNSPLGQKLLDKLQDQ